MTALDHAAEAMICVDSARRNTNESVDPVSAIRGGLDMLQALMHATLAVAEQQRLGNLIALAHLEAAESGSTDRSAFDTVFESTIGIGIRYSVRASIREGLGIA